MGDITGSVKSKEQKRAEKKAKEAPKPKEYLVSKYAATDKADLEKNKKYLDKENKSYSAVIVRALRDAKGPLAFPQVMEAVARVPKRDAKVNVEANVRWYLNDLKKKGLVKHVEETVEAKSKDEARGAE